MPAFQKYRVNPDTLLYEVEKESNSSRFLRYSMMFLGTVAMAAIYFWLYVGVLGLELPKTILLKKENAAYRAQLHSMNRRMEQCEVLLDGLQQRDDGVYRNVFGMMPVPWDTRTAGFGGVNRYSFLDVVEDRAMVKKTVERLDVLTKMAYVQSKSFDDVAALSRRTGDMASCIPAICPMVPDFNIVRMTSPFGYRSDPIHHTPKMHSGMDFACDPGNPIYVTGDGVVESVKMELFGYGNHVLVDHGFGYKSHYAHMRNIFVVEGMKLKRGECLGESGSSGRVTGPHLHYEIIYRGNRVNPANYMDLEQQVDEYKDMVETARRLSNNVLRPHQRIKF